MTDQLVETQFDNAPMAGLPVQWEGRAYLSFVDPTKVTKEQYAEAFDRMVDFTNRADQAATMAKLTIARFVIDWSHRMANFPSTNAESIDDLGLETKLRRSWKTILKWCRVVEVLSPDEIDTRLSMSQLYAAASRSLPAGARRQDFIEGRKKILLEAANSDQDRGSRWVREQMSELARKTRAPDMPKRVSDRQLLVNSVLVFWLGCWEEHDLEVLCPSAEDFDQFKSRLSELKYEA